MEHQYLIKTRHGTQYIQSALSGMIRKPSLFSNPWKTFEGQVSDSTIQFDTYRVPVISIRGNFQQTNDGSEIKLKVSGADTKSALRLLLKTAFILTISLISLFRIISSPTSIWTYLIILLLIITGFVAYKILFFFLYHIHARQDPDSYIDAIAKTVKGKSTKLS